MIHGILTDNIYTALPDWNRVKRKGRALAAVIPALTGLITLAVEM